MKIYISLPIGGCESTVKERYEAAKQHIREMYPAAHIAGPVNINDFDETGLAVPRDHDWEWYMGEDFKELLTCTHIYMCQGWKYSRGCTDELALARAENMGVIMSPFAEMEVSKD